MSKKLKTWTPRDDPMRIISQWTTEEWREYWNRIEKAGKNDTGNELLTNTIEDTENIIRRMLEFELGNRKDAANHILDVFRFDAKKTCRRVDSKKPPTPFAFDHACGVLSYADRVRDDIEKNDAVQTMLDMFVLISSVIAKSGGGLDHYWILGEQVLDGIAASHTKGKVQGVLLAIKDIRKKGSHFQEGKRGAIWEHLRRLDKAGTPWTLTIDDIRYEITFADSDTLVAWEITEKGKKKNTLKKSTFIQKYLAKRE